MMDNLDVLLAHVSRQQLAAAAAWHVVRTRQITQFPSVLEFLETIHAAAPELITYRHYAKMTLGLKALIVVNMIYQKQSRRSINSLMEKLFPDPAPALPTNATRRDHMKISSAVETFKDTVQRLPAEQRIRAEYVKAELEEEYGEEFLAALEKLLREYFVRLESTMYKPRIQELREALKPAGRSLRSKEKEALSPLRILLCYFSDMGWPSFDWTPNRAEFNPPVSSRILPRRSCQQRSESNEGATPNRTLGRDCIQSRSEEKADPYVRILRKTKDSNYTSTDEEVLRCACEMLHPSMESLNVASIKPLSTPTVFSPVSNKKHTSHFAVPTNKDRNVSGQQIHGQTQERDIQERYTQKHVKHASSLKKVSPSPGASKIKVFSLDKGLQTSTSSLDATPVHHFLSKNVVKTLELPQRKNISPTSGDTLKKTVTQNPVRCPQKTAVHSTWTSAVTFENSEMKSTGTLRSSQQETFQKGRGSLEQTITIAKVNRQEKDDQSSPRVLVPQREVRQAQSPLCQQKIQRMASKQMTHILANEWTSPTTALQRPALSSPILKRRRLFLPEEVAGLILQEPVEECTRGKKTQTLEQKYNRELIVRLAPLDIQSLSCPWVQQSGDSCPNYEDSMEASRSHNFSPDTNSSVGCKRARSPQPFMTTEPQQMQENRGNSGEKLISPDMNKIAAKDTVLSALKPVSQNQSLTETSATGLRHVCAADESGTEAQSNMPMMSKRKAEATSEHKENTALLIGFLGNAEVIPLKSFCHGPSSDEYLSQTLLLQTTPENNIDVIVDSEDEGNSSPSKVSLQNYQKTKFNTYIPTFREHFRKNAQKCARPGAAPDMKSAS